LYQRTPLTHPEETRGPRLHVLGLLQRPEDHLALDLVQCLIQARPTALGESATRSRRSRRSTRSYRPAEHDGALDDVLELADVPRPAVVLEKLQRLR
jgi:hypothetical protein